MSGIDISPTKDGKPKVKVHGFGMTTRELLFRYPWASVDSTSWYSSRYGGCFLDVPDDDGTVRDYKIDFSSRSGKRSWHYDRLPPPHRKAISDRLEELEATRIRDPEFEAGLEKSRLPAGLESEGVRGGLRLARAFQYPLLRTPSGEGVSIASFAIRTGFLINAPSSRPW